MRQLLVVGFLLAAGCGSTESEEPSAADGTEPTSPSPTTSTRTRAASPSPKPAGNGTKIVSADSEFGTMLYNASGQPIYLFTAESDSRPVCYDDCAADWPPVLTKAEPRASRDVRQRLLGTTRRADGSTQVTYGGQPLYYYAHEGKYQVLCHDVEEYGGTWLVVRPDGSPAPA